MELFRDSDKYLSSNLPFRSNVGDQIEAVPKRRRIFFFLKKNPPRKGASGATSLGRKKHKHPKDSRAPQQANATGVSLQHVPHNHGKKRFPRAKTVPGFCEKE